MTHRAYIRRETLISMAINGLFSLVFFLVVFGRASVVPLWGMGNWVFDFLPQSFMITLMSTLVPGWFAARRLQAGELQSLSRVSRLPRSLVLRALLLSIGAALIGAAAVTVVALALGMTALHWNPALLVKVLYGMILAAVVTPIGLRSALTR